MRLFTLDGGGSRIKWALIENGHIQKSGIEKAVYGDHKDQYENIAQLHQQHGANSPLAISWAGETNTGCSISSLRAKLEVSPIETKVVTDDMVAAGLGEALALGDHDQLANIALLQIGTGVGSAMVIDGKIHKCISGHLVFRENGIPDSSGMRGTVDAYLGWRAIENRMRALTPVINDTNPEKFLQLAKERKDVSYLLDDALQAVGYTASILVACSNVKNWF